ncbi:hypothetical protein FB45DRAFT_871705 [Roridomyces roridus]|uniref:CsbD-like domain-containing protein n=1 Tax=Roridomyces roridus TaxID=1738132 RepID=A0AAD7FH07_9AGAR|nr:hypothetical protein FB45DRAFT_871705 [Roridomyces roridus]
MASIPNDINMTNEMRPEHHVHRTDEPLPGARGGAPAADYNPDTIERMPSSAWEDPSTRDTPDVTFAASADKGRDAFSEERLTGVQPHDGGVAIDGTAGHDQMPTGKASATDRVIGKAQKVIGKVTHNPEMLDKGELRETGGKAAMQARADHD